MYLNSYNQGSELLFEFAQPSEQGCHTPAEGVPLLATSNQESQPTAQADQSQNPVVATKQEASVACGDSTSSSIDTSMVKLRDKSKRGRAAEKVPFVVPRFDDLEEDQVTVSIFRFILNVNCISSIVCQICFFY